MEITKISFNNKIYDIVDKKALSLIDSLKSSLKTMNDAFAMLNNKLVSLSKPNLEVIEDFKGGTELNDSSKDYKVSDVVLNEATSITGNSISIENASVNASEMISETKKSPISINAKDVEISNMIIEGEFNQPLQGNTVISINNTEFVNIKDTTFDGTNMYNGIEIGLSNSEYVPKNIMIDNCKFLNKFTHNPISVFKIQNGGTITINNCYFENPICLFRFTNGTNSSNITINFNNCEVGNIINNKPSPSGGLICLQDHLSKTEPEIYETNMFAPNKVTINLNNLYLNGNKLVSDVESICGEGLEKIFVCANAKTTGGYVVSDLQYYPTININ